MAKTILLIPILKSLFLLFDVCMSIFSHPRLTNANTSSSTAGFSIDIFHQDSPESPYYDPSLSPAQTIANAIRRSLDRAQWLNRSHSYGSTETDVERPIREDGDYLMRFKIGQQEVHSLGILDTGSGLVWVQGFPCTSCFRQRPPVYEPRASTSYKVILCEEAECRRSSYTFCDQNKDPCLYSLDYEDGTYALGRLSKDTFILASAGGTTTRLYNFVFGCAYRAGGKFSGVESGVIGLGRGPDSLVSQLGPYAQGKFSYCFLSRFDHSKRSSSRLKFGDNADISGVGVVRTPLVPKPNFPNLYYVTLFGFNIGRTRYLYASNDGNFVVDSGWAETRLPDNMYTNLRRSLIATMTKLKTIKDPKGMLDLCFETRDDKLWFPTVTLHFKGDHADVSFAKENMFLRTSPNSLCLAVLPAGKGFAVLGHLAQVNFMVEYDTDMERMSFKSTNCSRS